jgi:hypothetical protein
MKKIFSLCLVAVLTLIVLFPSCKKKITHETHPTPNNIRVLSYSLIDSIYLSANDTTYVLNDNYSFYYDEAKRVSRILFTSINSAKPNRDIRFTYRGDTIYKVIYDIGTQNIVERDTFILNSQGFIKAAYTPGSFGMTNNFEYYGKLLSRQETIARDTDVTISALTTYTSVDGDLLKHNHDGNLYAKFEHLVDPSGTYSYKLDTIWWYNNRNFSSLIATHARINSFTDVLTNYRGNPVTVVGRDAFGNMDTGYFPGIWYNQAFEFYTTEGNNNRPGDYMQLESVSYFGMNVYQNKHLVRKISSPGRVTDVSYNIDADSKIKQTFVHIKDSALNTHDMKYEIQYELF